MDVLATQHLPRVKATISYLAPPDGKPYSLEYEPPAGVPRTTAIYSGHEVTIRDLRPIASAVSLEREGFALVNAPSTLRDFRDEAAIRERYYEESIELVRKLTGGQRVVVFDHTLRRQVAGATDRTAGVPRQPVPRVHNDYTEKSGPQRVRDLLGDEADELLRRRVSIVNVWRPINGPVQDAPLAVVDAQSVQKRDLIPTDLVYTDRVGEIYYVGFNPDHRWFYAPAMSDDEVMLIKCYDSMADGRARFVPHCAFKDPGAPRNARPRESIELRTLVFYGD